MHNIIAIPYFLFQSVSDVRSKQVYVLPNLVVLSLSALWFFLSGKDTEQVFWTVAVAVIVFLLGRRFWGSGDVKCVLAALFTYQAQAICVEDGLKRFFLWLFLAMLAFLVFAGIKKLKKKEKMCFFPFMFVSYIVCGC